MDKTSLTLGWLVGRRIAGQRKTVEKQPIAYLYNGVQLPPLPEYDREKYPCAVIATDAPYTSKPYEYHLYLCQSFELSSYGSTTFTFTVYNGKRYKFAEDSGKTSFELDGEYESSALWYSTHTWNNFGIQKDGELILPASDPIPVYE